MVFSGSDSLFQILAGCGISARQKAETKGAYVTYSKTRVRPSANRTRAKSHYHLDRSNTGHFPGKIMKTHFRIFLSLFLLSSLLLTACGPAPNPKLQAKSAEESPDRAADQPKEQERVAVVEQPVPARVEELPPQNLPKPKQQLPKQPIARQTANRPGVSSQSGIDQKPLPAPVADTVSSSAPGTITLPAPAAPPVTIPAPPPDETEARPIDRPVEPPAPKRINVPSGTLVAVRMIDSVNSETSRVDETFKASLDEAIVLDGETVFPEGAEVYVKLARVQSAGRVKGQKELLA
jgi:hypothetical protein